MYYKTAAVGCLVIVGLLFAYHPIRNAVYPPKGVYQGVTAASTASDLIFRRASQLDQSRTVAIEKVLHKYNMSLENMLVDETGLLLLGKENKDNTYLLVQITPNGVHGLPVAALEKEGNQRATGLQATEQGFWVALGSRIFLVDKAVTKSHLMVEDYSYDRMQGNLLAYKNNSILYVNRKSELVSYPSNTVLHLLPLDSQIAGWANQDSHLFISRKNNTYVTDLAGGTIRKAFNHDVRCIGNVRDTSLMVLIPQEPGHPAFIDTRAIQDNFFRNDSVYEYEPFLYNEETDEVAPLPDGPRYQSLDDEILDQAVWDLMEKQIDNL